MQQDINMADRAPVGPPTALPGTVWADAHADARADAIFDSAKLFKSSFLPSNIPVRSDPFFRAGEHATIAPGVATKVLIDARADLSGSSSSRLIASDADPSFRLVTELEFFTLADSSEGVQARQIFGQFNNVLAGKTYTLFSDVDALPNLISNVGPNASTLISHGVLGYYFTSGPFFQIPGQRSFVAAVSIETPEDSVSALTPHIPNPYPFTVTDKTKFNSYSQVPDFAAKIRYTDNSLGHVQAATILRSIDIETDTAPTTTGMNPIPHPINTRQGVFGWGVMLSGAYYPFQSVCELQEDHVMGQIVYGEGVGSYIVDLTDSSGTPGAGSVTGSDAAFDTNNKLKALPVLAYYAGYTHWWALDKLRSTVVYSDVDLDTMAQNAPGYRHGRFVAANIIYQWGITYTDKDNKPQTHQAFVGLEYLYGQKDTVSHGSGDDHRITLSVGAKY
jgi:hypothetical protein